MCLTELQLWSGITRAHINERKQPFIACVMASCVDWPYILLPGQLVLPATREIVLEYVVERKRMDDLAGSIIDGRFHEQKVVSGPNYCMDMK